MKQKILRLLWLDEEGMRAKKSKVAHYCGIAIFICLSLLLIVFYLSIKESLAEITNAANVVVLEMRSDLTIPWENENIKNATLEDLQKLPGITQPLAEKIAKAISN